MNKYMSIIEGLIFMAGEEGLSLAAIQSLLKNLTKKDILMILDEIKTHYEASNRGIELVKYGGRYKFVTKESVYPYGKKLFENIRKVSLSQAAMETLAIIAYKQPITRAEIEEIRGVSCDLMLKKLMARDLIEAKDRLDAVGKPLLYTVTDTFMDAFELGSLSELPELTKPEESTDLFER